VRAIAERFGSVDVAMLFAGGAKTALLGDAFLTLSSPQAAEAVPALLEILEGEDGELRGDSAAALGEIALRDPAPALRACTGLLRRAERVRSGPRP